MHSTCGPRGLDVQQFPLVSLGRAASGAGWACAASASSGEQVAALLGARGGLAGCLMTHIQTTGCISRRPAPSFPLRCRDPRLTAAMQSQAFTAQRVQFRGEMRGDVSTKGRHMA